MSVLMRVNSASNLLVGNWLVLQWLLRQFPSISGWGIIADFLKAALLAFDSLCLLLMWVIYASYLCYSVLIQNRPKCSIIVNQFDMCLRLKVFTSPIFGNTRYFKVGRALVSNTDHFLSLYFHETLLLYSVRYCSSLFAITSLEVEEDLSIL